MSPPDLKLLGQKIRQLREDAGMKPAELARRVPCSATYIGDIERAKPGKDGDPVRPSVLALRGIAAALDAPLAELLEMAGYDDFAAIERARAARVRRSDADEDPVLSALSGVIAPEDLPTVLEIVNRFRKPVDGDA